MTSRLRKFDKSILSQTIDLDNDDDDGHLLDTQDQINLIDKLTISNREIFKNILDIYQFFIFFKYAYYQLFKLLKNLKIYLIYYSLYQFY